ncbi:MAG: hypothetical protein RIC15_04205 [Vicingaceae bacterium]
MKSITTVLFLMLTIQMVAQDDRENSYILICNSNQSEFSLDDYRECNYISVRDSENEVASFLFVALKKSKRIEMEIEGNELTEEALSILEKLKAPAKLRIEKVVDETGTPLEGFRELVIRE